MLRHDAQWSIQRSITKRNETFFLRAYGRKHISFLYLPFVINKLRIKYIIIKTMRHRYGEHIGVAEQNSDLAVDLFAIPRNLAQPKY
jgi:hypothetical protein